MKKRVWLISMIFILSAPAWAEKPEWAGEGKPRTDQIETHREAMKAKGGEYDLDDDRSGKKEKWANEKEKKNNKHQQEAGADEVSGLAKQADKKAGQPQKELDKGAEEGQESREDRKKWWKFWEYL